MGKYLMAFALACLIAVAIVECARAEEPPLPVLAFGVMGCGYIVVWIANSDGQMERYDKDHMPKDLAVFRKMVESLTNDIVVVPCEK